MSRSHQTCAFLALLFFVRLPSLEAATIHVAAGGDLQAALNAAQPGDTILLQEGAEFVGAFVLPFKTGNQWITLRTSAPDTVLPPTGSRIRPSHAPLLARLRSPTAADAALRTAPGAHHWRIAYLEFGGSFEGNGDIVQIGDGSSAQNSLALVPHDIVLSHLYIHGDPLWGQKRGIALNAASVTIRDSHIADCKGVGQDTQAIGGWNGPGPYTIENNYLEAAGENIMFGGADPSIANLVADGVTFRGNYVSRPMAWRNPIVGTPAVTSAREAGGSLPAGAYAYRVVAQGVARGTLTPQVTIRSTASPESVVTASSGASAIRIRWQPVSGATWYRVFGRSSGALTQSWSVTGTEFLDTGAPGIADTLPTTTGTVWNVKNIFELKSARNVVVENNIFENHWKEGQPGFAVVLTPRNSGGGCPWCVVENVRFEYNIFRNIAAGVNLLGYDSPRPTRQTNNISFLHNVFVMNTSLGGPARLLQIDAGPRDVILEHNTVDANGSGVVYVVGGTSLDPKEVDGFEMTANAARHGSYGIHGAYFGYGNDIIAHYFPGGVFQTNYLAGALASRYPSGTLVTPPFEAQFVNTTAGDYTVRAGSILEGAAPGGSNVGADYPTLAERLQHVQTGEGDVTAVLHAAVVSSSTKKWTSPSGATNYWSAAVTVAAHGADDRPIAGATITTAWTGGVTKTATCITASNGQCTFQSGTLSYLRSWVTLTLTNVSAPLSTYSGSANHTPSGAGSAVTMNRP